MGEIADMVLNGTMCSGCGEWLHDGEDGPGFPGLCESCASREHGAKPLTPSRRRNVGCPHCTKRFHTHDAYLQHYRDKHSPPTLPREDEG